MKYPILLTVLICLANTISAQKFVYNLTADSVKVTGCDSAELIIENHTQGVPGFLYNTGKGRTIFKRGVVKINDSLFLIGADTLKVLPANFWSLTGNAGTDTAKNYIGTRDNTPVFFRTGGIEKMRLFTNGNLMINSSPPFGIDNGFKLQVNGNMFANGAKHLIGNLGITDGYDVLNLGTTTGIRIDNNNTASFIFQGSFQGWASDMFVFTTSFANVSKPLYNTDASIIRIQSGFNNANVGGLSANTLFINPSYEHNPGSWPMTFRGIYYKPTVGNMIAGSKHIAIETVTGDVLLGTNSGNVGIGTSSPTAQFHTTGTVRFAGLTSDTTQTRIVVSDASGNLYYRAMSSLHASNGIPGSSLADNGVINSSLAVNGTLSAKKLTLSQSGWPDYVFAPDYHLPSLQDLERYIKQHSHLPGIPSTAEVEKKGLEVGDNQAALLKKIEELTLYMIEQDKKSADQHQQLENQRNEMEILKNEIAELKQIVQKNNLK